MSNNQSATERAVRLAVEGGYEPHRIGYTKAHFYNAELDSLLFEMGVVTVSVKDIKSHRYDAMVDKGLKREHEIPTEGQFKVDVERFLLDPSFWRALASRCEWKGHWCRKCRCEALRGSKHAEFHHEEVTGEGLLQQHGLLDHLAAHPGDHEGYLSGLISDVK